MLKRCPIFIGISGIIGAGKTTLCSSLAKMVPDCVLVKESVDDNPYLDDFYKDPARWSFEMQIYMLGKRFVGQMAIVDSVTPVVQDRTIYEDMIFATVLRRRNQFSERDYQTYMRIFGAMTSLLPAPDVVAFLDVDPCVAMERIRHRARPCEMAIPMDYLDDLCTEYRRWFDSLPGTTCKIRINIPDEAHVEQAACLLADKIGHRILFKKNNPTCPDMF